MKIYKSLDEILSPLKNPVVTIGNFDGVHKGHLKIFKRLESLASEISGVSVVITFDPHPLKVLKPEAPL
ncbi:MAG: adenylyltransferase/cytidyltransferase family protein, partial [Desulfuromonadales bacterium]|nr:adenylyltransferase/cytidyltransferase family protein [Desulfuromonadales bacterium]